MKFFSILKTRDVRSSSSSWAWPSCHQPKTLSFRVTATATNKNKSKNKNNDDDKDNDNDVVLKSINSALVSQTPESFFTDSPNSASFSTASELSRGVDPIETVIRGLRSDRLFFEPDETSSILDAKLTSLVPFQNSVVLSMDSNDPYVDFRKSMEEMVETLGVKDWESLEDLLCWYLKANRKCNHEYIVGAFVDLLFDLAFANNSSLLSKQEQERHSRPSSPLSFYSSSSCSTRCVYCLEGRVVVEEEEEEEKEEEEEEEEEIGAYSSSFSLAQVKEEITPEDEASSSS